MKANAITRIVIYSILILLLIGILCACLGLGQLTFQLGKKGTYVYDEVSLAASDISGLSIDWVSGSIRITTGDTDTITFCEEGESDDQRMSYWLEGGTLHLSYSTGLRIGFVSSPSKDLSIIVPKDWVCSTLEIDGASLDIDSSDMTIGTIELDGASNKMTATGMIDQLESDGASNSVTLNCTGPISQINMDGASCKLDLTLPKDHGFRAELEGLSCDLDTELPYTNRDDCYCYGDEYCRIDVDGVSCKVNIKASA